LLQLRPLFTSAAIALVALASCDIAWNPALVGGAKRTAAESKGLRDVQELVARGDLGRAVDAAHALVADAEQKSGDVADAQQVLGLALAAADRPDEATAIAAKLETTAGDNVRSAIAATRCAYDEAQALQSKNVAAAGEKTTVANLAELDIAAGRHARAIERLEHALRLPHPEKTPPDVASTIDRQMTRSLAIAYLRAGRIDEGKARLKDIEAGELEDAALRTAEYAVREKRALRRAALALSGALLASRARDGADDPRLKDAWEAVLRAYRETPSPCRDALPDLAVVDRVTTRS
jgi:tetratricopeptide (TPR) repeat protein